MMNKGTANDEQHQTITWGAAQLGIAQGVLDAVADGLLEASGDLVVLVAVWVDPGAHDETAVRTANRVRRARRSASASRVATRPQPRLSSNDATSFRALLQRRLMRIASIETRVYRCPLDPPFTAAWDPVPRTHQDATVVIVRSDDGVEGYERRRVAGSRAARATTRRPRAGSDEIHGVLETVDFHHGRNWTLEVAVWDLLGRAEGKPLWKLLGGERDRIGAYASTGELVSPDGAGPALRRSP